MSGITVVSANPGVEARILDLFGRDLAVRRVWSDQWRSPVESAMDAGAADPDLILIGGDVQHDDSVAIIPEIDRRYPAAAIVVLLASDNRDHTVELLRLGARDVLSEAIDNEELGTRVEELLSLARERRATRDPGASGLRRRSIAVLSPKGGTGKTTLSTNLAVALAKRLPKQVLLVDLDLQFGDSAAALGIKPEHSLTHVINSADHERSALKVFLAPHESGLSVLSPPDDLAEADAIDPDQLKRAIGALVEEFPFVIFDTSAGIDAPTIAALEFATDYLVVSTTDVPSIRALRRQLDALDQIGFHSQRRTFVLNRSNAKVGLDRAEIEAAIGMEASFEIPSARAVPISTNEGIPLVMKDSGGLARTFDDIADYFAPQTRSQSRGLLRGLRKER